MNDYTVKEDKAQRRPSIDYPQMVELIARAAAMVQELHEALNQDTASRALGIKKSSLQFHINKVRRAKRGK